MAIFQIGRVGACFDEYCASYRAASVGVNDRKLAYDKVRVDHPYADGQAYTHYLHFIDGTYQGPNRADQPGSLAYREMGVESWLQASGMNDVIYQILKDHFSHLFGRAQLQNTWDYERAHPDIKQGTPPREKIEPEKLVQGARLDGLDKVRASFVGSAGGEVVPLHKR